MNSCQKRVKGRKEVCIPQHKALTPDLDKLQKSSCEANTAGKLDGL